jgi:hypothetical protein
MSSRTLIPFLAAALVLGACSDKPTGPGASDDANSRSINTNSLGPVVLPATGTLADGGSFVGEIEIQRIDLNHETGQFIISGILQGKATPIDGKMKQVKQAFSTVSTIGGQGAVAAAARNVVIQQEPLACPVLALDLGPLHLDLLGLVVDLAPVILDITAQPGAGNLLGNLLCAILGILDLPGLFGVVSQLLDVVNQILGGLGGAA